MLGRVAIPAVMFTILIILYTSATGAIIFAFCSWFIKSCRNKGLQILILFIRGQEVEKYNRNTGVLEQTISQEVHVHTSSSHS